MFSAHHAELNSCSGSWNTEPHHRNKKPARSSMKVNSKRDAKRVCWHPDVLENEGKARPVGSAHQTPSETRNSLTTAQNECTTRSGDQVNRVQTALVRTVPAPTTRSIISTQLHCDISRWLGVEPSVVYTQTDERAQLIRTTTHTEAVRRVPDPTTISTRGPDLDRAISTWLKRTRSSANKVTNERVSGMANQQDTSHAANSTRKRDSATVDSEPGFGQTRRQLQGERSVPPAVPDAPQSRRNTSLQSQSSHSQRPTSRHKSVEDRDHPPQTPRTSRPPTSDMWDVKQQDFYPVQKPKDVQDSASKMAEQLKAARAHIGEHRRDKASLSQPERKNRL